MPHFLLSLLPRKKKEWSIIILTGSIFLGTFYLGLVFGRARSIDYTQDGSTLKYLASRMKVDKFSQDDIQLIFDDGPKTYRYSLKADELAIEPKDPWKLKVERRWATLEYSRAAEITGLTAVEGGLLAVATRYHEAIGLAARYSPLAHRSAYIHYGRPSSCWRRLLPWILPIVPGQARLWPPNLFESRRRQVQLEKICLGYIQLQEIRKD